MIFHAGWTVASDSSSRLFSSKEKDILKKIISVLLAAVMTLAVPLCSWADDNGEMSFRFDLTVNGQTSVTVQPGSEVDVEARLVRTDTDESFDMYAVQYDIWYDSDIFELIADSLSGGTHELRINESSLDGSREGWRSVSASAYSTSASGDKWANGDTVVAFKLKAKRAGIASLQSKNYYVSRSDGMSSYDVSANDAVVTVKIPDSDKGDTGGDTSDSGNNNNGSSNSNTGGSASGGSSAGGGTSVKPDAPSETPVNDNDASSAKPSARFDDIAAGAWYESAVSYALEKGLFSGTSEKTFSPNGTMTRSMLVTVLWRMEGTPAAAAGSPFNDVESGKWYTDAVTWASSNGIVTGYGNGTFGVSDSVTRQQLAAILYRYASLKGMDVSASADISVYADASEVASWAKEPVAWTVKNGIINGVSGNKLSPSGTATRAQAAAMLMRFADVKN